MRLVERLVVEDEIVPAVAVAQSTLGLCLTAAGRYAEAEPLLVESYTVLRDTHGSEDTARERVAALYQAWDRPEQLARFLDP